MANEIALYTEKGLTTEEASLVQKWVESGRPGISRIKADFLSSIYNLGYSCQQIHAKFPEYQLEGILWARAHFEWDKRRVEYNKELKTSTLQHAGEAHLEGINLLATVLKVTNVRWRDEVVRYLAAPDREKPPEFLPTSLHQYMNAQTQLAELMAPPAQKNGQPAQAGAQVFINAPGANVSNVDPKDVAKAMIDEMKNKDKK